MIAFNLMRLDFSIPENLLYIDSYKFVRTDSSRNETEFAFFSATPLPKMSRSYSPNDLEAVSEIWQQKNKSIIIKIIYQPPNTS